MNCPECQMAIPDESQFCLKCGSDLGASRTQGGAAGGDGRRGRSSAPLGGTSIVDPLTVNRMPTLNDPLAKGLGEGNADSDHESSVALGSVVAGYELMKVLGEGGFATVYLARQLSLGRNVAVKRLKPRWLASPLAEQAVARFRREAHTIARLEHRNIVRVIDRFEELTGHYIVMPYYPGPTLAEYLKENPQVPASTALAVIKAVCRGLQYAHQQGVVHRDVKPNNIILAREDGKTVPKLLDFGLARVESDAALTLSQEGMGTRYYTAPELLDGRAEVVDARVDVYSIGKLLYRMLTADVPDTLDPELLAPFGTLVPIIYRCVKRPEDRYPNVDAVLDAIETARRTVAPPAPKASTMATPTDGEIDQIYSDAVRMLEGNGIPKNANEAVRLLKHAAERGNAKAQTKLGQCYLAGEGVEQCLAEVEKWYRKAAEQGYSVAQTKLANYLYFGWGVGEGESAAAESNRMAVAVELYRKAAEQGDAEAQSRLWRCYWRGEGVDKDHDEALKWRRIAAEHGDPDEQCELGEWYEESKGVEHSHVEAAKWYRKAAEQEHRFAQYKLGVCYEMGCGVSQDTQEAINWFRKSANGGGRDAQNTLGAAYYHGKGVPKDYVESMKWFRLAAEGDHPLPRALFNLGVCYKSGRGVAKDLNAAIACFRKAAELEDPDAKQALEQDWVKNTSPSASRHTSVEHDSASSATQTSPRDSTAAAPPDAEERPSAALEVQAGAWSTLFTWGIFTFPFGLAVAIGCVGWKYFVIVEGIEHQLKFAKRMLIAVSPGNQEVEFCVQGRLGGKKSLRQTYSFYLAPQTIRPMVYRMAHAPLGPVFAGFRMCVIKPDSPRTIAEAI